MVWFGGKQPKRDATFAMCGRCGTNVLRKKMESHKLSHLAEAAQAQAAVALEQPIIEQITVAAGDSKQELPIHDCSASAIAPAVADDSKQELPTDDCSVISPNTSEEALAAADDDNKEENMCDITENESKDPEGPAIVKRKPAFVKVCDLKPESYGHNVTAKVMSVMEKRTRPSFSGGGRRRIAECLIGDETGTILFTARNAEVDLMKGAHTVIIRNAKINMLNGSMRLAVDKWGRVEVTEPASFTVKEDNNLSLVEY